MTVLCLHQGVVGCCANLLDDKVNIFVRGVPGKPELCFPPRYNYDPRTQLL